MLTCCVPNAKRNRKSNDSVPSPVFLGEALEAPLKTLHRGAGRDIAEEVAPDDAFLRQARKARFVTIVLLDRALVIDADQAERQIVDLLRGEIEDGLRVVHDAASSFS